MKVSVIIAAYNVALYLARCIESLVGQDYKNIEIIIVNDGSTDESLVIAEKYAVNDERITIISQNNGGISNARNTGLKVASGEYVAFVDGDDYVSSAYIDQLLKHAIEKNADISVSNYYKTYKNDDIKKDKPSEDVEFTNVEALRDLFSKNSVTEVVPWNKLYKRDLFMKNSIYFPDGKIHEDNFTTYRLYYYADKITFFNKPLYFYVQRSGSIMDRNFEVSSMDMLLAADLAVKLVHDKNIPLEDEVQAYRLSIIITILNKMVDSKNIDKKLWHEQVLVINKSRNMWLLNKNVTIIHKLLIITVSFGILPYVSLRKVYMALKKEVVYEK